MSEEVSSSSAAPTGSKHAREEDGEAEAAAPAKKPRQDTGDSDGPSSSTADKAEEGGSGLSKAPVEEEEDEEGGGEVSGGVGVTSESDEEYQVGGSDGEPSDDEGNEGDSTDISAEEEEEFDEEETVKGATNIVCGQSVQLKEIKDGKYRLYHEDGGRELKLLLPLEASTDAEKLSLKIQSDNEIPVLEAQGAEVTRDEGDEVIVYAQSLSATENKYGFHDDDPGDEINNQMKGVLLQGNKLVVLKIEGLSEIFATGDFNTQPIED